MKKITIASAVKNSLYQSEENKAQEMKKLAARRAQCAMVERIHGNDLAKIIAEKEGEEALKASIKLYANHGLVSKAP